MGISFSVYMCIFIIYYYIRAVGSKLKVVRPESAGSHCGRGFLHVDVARRKYFHYEILSLLLVAFQCTGSCREWLQW